MSNAIRRSTSKPVIKAMSLLPKLYALMTHYAVRANEAHHRVLLRQQVARGHLTIGRHSYGLKSDSVSGASALANVSIGSFCSFAPGVRILANVDHPLDRPSTFPFRTLIFRGMSPAATDGAFNADVTTRGPVRIGDDVWVGQSVFILSGVTIGTGCVIGAGAVVTRSLPPYSIAVGNPARIVRQRFSDADIALLLTSCWWDLSDAELERLAPTLYSTDIAKFANAASLLRQDRLLLESSSIETER